MDLIRVSTQSDTRDDADAPRPGRAKDGHAPRRGSRR